MHASKREKDDVPACKCMRIYIYIYIYIKKNGRKKQMLANK